MRQFEVRVKTGSSKGPLVEEEAGGNLTVYLRERPHQGNANKALVQVIAKFYDIPRSRIEILRGLTSNRKTIRVK